MNKAQTSRYVLEHCSENTISCIGFFLSCLVFRKTRSLFCAPLCHSVDPTLPSSLLFHGIETKSVADGWEQEPGCWWEQQQSSATVAGRRGAGGCCGVDGDGGRGWGKEGEGGGGGGGKFPSVARSWRVPNAWILISLLWLMESSAGKPSSPRKLEYNVCYNKSMVSHFVFGENLSLNPFKRFFRRHFRIVFALRRYTWQQIVAVMLPVCTSSHEHTHTHCLCYTSPSILPPHILQVNTSLLWVLKTSFRGSTGGC